MFGSMQTGVNAYARVGVETGVIAASPHKLISMLFEGAIVALSNAVRHTHAREIAAKGQSISKAIAIIENGLRESLNKEAGGSIAVSLDALYVYMSGRLLEANIKSDPAMMDEVAGLLRDLKQSWDSIADRVSVPASAAINATTANTAPASPDALANPVDALMPRHASLVKA